MNKVILGLGGNEGDVLSAFDRALMNLQLDETLHDIRRSSVYRSRSLLRDSQLDYHNVVCVAYTDLKPSELLSRIKEEEKIMGRVSKERWQARPLDIDIIDYAGLVIDNALLTLPHSQMQYRSFVLIPLQELVPDYVNPKIMQGVKQMINALKDDFDIVNIKDIK